MKSSQVYVVFRMDASEKQSTDISSAPLTVVLSHFFTHVDNLFIQVETTAPPLRKKKRRSLIRSARHAVLKITCNYAAVIRKVIIQDFSAVVVDVTFSCSFNKEDARSNTCMCFFSSYFCHFNACRYFVCVYCVC